MDELPNRLCTEMTSPFYKPSLAKRIEVYFNDIRQVNCVIEFNVAEGWLRRYKTTAYGQRFERNGILVEQRLEGTVRVVWKD